MSLDGAWGDNVFIQAVVVMRRSIPNFNITSPATSRAFELLKVGSLKFLPLGAKKPFKCPTN